MKHLLAKFCFAPCLQTPVSARPKSQSQDFLNPNVDQILPETQTQLYQAIRSTMFKLNAKFGQNQIKYRLFQKSVIRHQPVVSSDRSSYSDSVLLDTLDAVF